MYYRQTLCSLRSKEFTAVTGNLRLGRNSEIVGNPYLLLFATDTPGMHANLSQSTKTFTTYFTVDVQALYPDKTIVSVLAANMFGTGAMFSIYFLLPVRYYRTLNPSFPPCPVLLPGSFKT
jgi:hypothetical protein